MPYPFKNIGFIRLSDVSYGGVKLCPKGFEPPTHGLEGRCSIQLSYGHMLPDSYSSTSSFRLVSLNSLEGPD